MQCRTWPSAPVIGVLCVLGILPVGLATSQSQCFGDDNSSRDSGGDLCSYYADKPQYCGCCDTATFSSWQCCTCQQTQTPAANASWWTWVYYTWPAKATALNLPGRGIQAQLPLDIAERWRWLVIIDLSQNSFWGGLPPGLGNLSSLQYLDLSSNFLQGSLPAELGGLRSLQTLKAQGNQLSGSLPQELGRLTSLVELNLDNNGFTGALPAGLGNLTALQTLSVANNQLGGRLPAELGNLARLQLLSLWSNQLTGPLPAELGGLTSLTQLYLSTNRITGALPASLGNLSALQALYLNDNQFSGVLPPELGKLTTLTVFYLSNNQLTGSLPPELGNVTSMQYLLAGKNRLSGSLPPELGKLTRLVGLSLNENLISGSLPPQLGNLGSLGTIQWIDVRANRLTGGIPPEFGKLTTLESLALDTNELNGTLPPELGNLPRLSALYLQLNKLTGPIPRDIGKMTSLRFLWLRGNQLTGSLPAELGNCTNIQDIHVHNNLMSGSLPPELGNLTNMLTLRLNNNMFSGSLPPELGRLTRLLVLDLHYNQFNGSLPPEFGNLQSMGALRLQANSLSGGFPPSFSGLNVAELKADMNPGFCGGAEVVTHMAGLAHLSLRGCCFQDFAGLPARLQHLDLGQNLLTELPSAWRQPGSQPLALKTLLLDGNNISQWDTSAVVPLSYAQAGAWTCGYIPPGPRFPWQQLEILDVAGNPINTAVYYFLGSLSHLSQLRVLRARDAGLLGTLPDISTSLSGKLAYFVPNVEHTGDQVCTSPWEFNPEGFPALLTLDLSGNRITAVHAFPPGRLVQADLSRNKLTALSSQWWMGGNQGALQRVDVTGNAGLQLPVFLNDSSACPVMGASALTANAQGWNAQLEGKAECTTLCSMVETRFLADAAVNESVLCRCAEGQGVGRDCSPCPEDTFSNLSFGQGQYSRSCSVCPANSHLRDVQGICFADCNCDAGYYMAQIINDTAQDVGASPCSRLAPKGECRFCGVFKTSLQGSRKESDCFCNSNRSNGGWEGLLERQKGQCGCPDGFHMNFAERTCIACQPQEDCTDWTRSLEPPSVSRGFWTAPAPPRGSDGLFGNFSGHFIWRCQSSVACPGNSACGGNLTGTACSLCRRGFFRNPSGTCTPCARAPAETRLLLGAGLLACMVFPFLVHLQLRADMKERRGLAAAFAPVRTSVKQILKFAQIVGLISLFGVEWPGLAEPVFTVARASTLDFAGWLGVACLDDQQQESMALEMGFRWMLPLAGVVVTCLAALLVTIAGLVLGPVSGRCCKEREERIRQKLRFRPLDVLRVLVFFLNLFFPSLLKNALLPLTCAPSPNGLLTLNAFPHIACQEGGQGWWTVAILGMVQTALLSFGFPLLLYFAWKRIDTSENEEVQKERQRWWRFIFVDFRPHKIFWILVAVSRDIALNLMVVILPGLGTAQLLVTAIISIVYACAAFCTSPYPDLSNTLLETCTGTAVAALCLFTSGVGFQSDTDMPSLEASIVGGGDGSGYAQRTIALVCLQGLSFLCPAAIVCFQLLAAFPRSRVCLPKSLRPLSDEQREEWSEDFSKVMMLEGGPLPSTLAQLDKVDFRTFRQAAITGKLKRKSMSIRSNGSQAAAENTALKAELADLQAAREEDSMTIQQLQREVAFYRGGAGDVLGSGGEKEKIQQPQSGGSQWQKRVGAAHDSAAAVSV